MSNELKRIKISDIAIDNDFNSRLIDLNVSDTSKTELPDDKEDVATTDPLGSLAASIKQDGQITPVVVRRLPPGSDKPYSLVAGFRRLAAMGLRLGMTEVDAQINDMTEQQAALVNLLENEQRKDLSSFELGHMAKRLRDKYKYTMDVIAAKISRSPSYVNNLVLNHENLHPRLLDAWSGRLGKGPKKIATTDNLNKWRNLPKEEQVAAYEKASGLPKKNKDDSAVPSDVQDTANGKELSDDGKPIRVKVRPMNDFNAAYEFFASDMPDSISVLEMETVRKVLNWATGRTDKLISYDIGEYAKHKAEKDKEKKNDFEKFMSDKATQAMMLEMFEKAKKEGKPLTVETVATVAAEVANKTPAKTETAPAKTEAAPASKKGK